MISRINTETANDNLPTGANSRADYKQPIQAALSLLWSCQGPGVVVLGCSPPAGLWFDLIRSCGVDWLARLRPRRSPCLLARRPPLSRLSPRPGSSRSTAPPRAPRPAGCSLRARPRPMRLPTGTSPLSLRRTRKVRRRLTGLEAREAEWGLRPCAPWAFPEASGD